jgi:radical SAM superfamily enzyme YgiQ (UPF0313 family)
MDAAILSSSQNSFAQHPRNKKDFPMRSVRTLLVFPPLSSYFSIHRAIPSLLSWLEVHGKAAVAVDLNMEFHKYVQDVQRLKDQSRIMHDKVCAFHESSELSGDDAIRYCDLALAYLRTNFGAKAVASASSIQSTEEKFLDGEKRLWSRHALNAAYLGTGSLDRALMDMESCIGPWSPYSSADITKFLHSPSQVFKGFFERELKTRVEFLRGFDILGVSVSFRDQILPALLLCQMVKNQDPSKLVVIGGTATGPLQRLFTALPQHLEFVDLLVVGQGEVPLLALVEASETRNDIGIRQCTGEAIRLIHANEPICLSELPVPDYDFCNLSEFPSPYPALPLQSRNACFWNRCLFCLHHFEPSRTIPVIRTPGDVMAEITALSKRYGITKFSFLDECLDPIFAAEFCRLIEATDYQWVSHMRFGQGETAALASALADAGCAAVKMGLESIDNGDLKRMNKGTDAETISATIDTLAAKGIAVQVSFFCGFPGQASESVLRTARFMRDRRERLCRVAFFGPFLLSENSLSFQLSRQLGISNLRKYNTAEDLLDMYRYEVRTGMTQQEAFRLASRIHSEFSFLQRTAVTYADGHTCYWREAKSAIHHGPEDCGISQVPLPSGEREFGWLNSWERVEVADCGDATASLLHFPLVDMFKNFEMKCDMFPNAVGRIKQWSHKRPRRWQRLPAPVPVRYGL